MIDAHLPPRGYERCGSLPGGVIVKTEPGGQNHLYVIYLGDKEALCSAGCLTPAMIESREKYRKGSSHCLRDEHGEKFHLHRYATKTMPDRMKLCRSAPRSAALRLPGVQELFPDGIKEPTAANIEAAKARESIINIRARCLEYSLSTRYPGVFVHVSFNDHAAAGRGTYRGWHLSFESTDPDLLVRYGLAPSNCDFRWGDGLSDLVGVNWHTHDIIDNSKRYAVGYHIEEDASERDTRASPFTKKTQSQVMRALRPFISGTWKPVNSPKGARDD